MDAANGVLRFLLGWMYKLAICSEQPTGPGDLITADAWSLFSGNVFTSTTAFMMAWPALIYIF